MAYISLRLIIDVNRLEMVGEKHGRKEWDLGPKGNFRYLWLRTIPTNTMHDLPREYYSYKWGY